MDTKMEAVQESIKLALDAADAATDVTSEYNKVKKAHALLALPRGLSDPRYHEHRPSYPDP